MDLIDMTTVTSVTNNVTNVTDTDYMDDDFGPTLIPRDLPETGRPPADKMVNEIFFDRKCGPNPESFKKFFTWCMNPKAGMKYTGKCDGVTGVKGDCIITATLNPLNSRWAQGTDDQTMIVDYQQTVDWFAVTNGTKTTVPPKITNAPGVSSTTQPPIKGRSWLFDWMFRCYYGTNKWTDYPGNYKVSAEKFDEIQRFCEQQIYGPPFEMPLWLLLLIIFAVIISVGGAAMLFWNLWLRRKIYGEDKSRSGLSQWTSAPFSNSSVSNLSGRSHSSSGRPSSRNAGSSRAPSGSRVPSVRPSHRQSTLHNPSSGSGSLRRSTRRSSIPGLL